LEEVLAYQKWELYLAGKMTLSDELSALSLGPTKFYEWAIARSDPRVADWFLMQSPLPTIALIIVYLTIVNIGPRLMKNRKPFDLKPILVVYNLFLVGLSAYIVFELVDASYRAGYNYICQPMSYSNDKNHVRIAAALWWYWFSKFIEFFDTFFFILRKKSNQVTFLHVYHHASMAYLWWIGIKWVAGGQCKWVCTQGVWYDHMCGQGTIVCVCVCVPACVPMCRYA
jgi:elongation of very long chain fatty acids protein 4